MNQNAFGTKKNKVQKTLTNKEEKKWLLRFYAIFKDVYFNKG